MAPVESDLGTVVLCYLSDISEFKKSQLNEGLNTQRTKLNYIYFLHPLTQPGKYHSIKHFSQGSRILLMEYTNVEY